MQQRSSAGRLAAPSPCRRHRHQRMAFRGPLSLLWLALSVGTGPVACFVVLPTSTPVAAASPLPKIVLGSRQGGRGAARSSSSGSQRRLYAFARRSEQERRALGQATDDDEQAADASSAQRQDEDSSPTATTTGKAVKASQHAVVVSTGIQNARAFRAAAALSQGKGFRAAATALKASATGVDVGAPTETTTTTRPKKILIIMSDTGGGHRASSQALNAALENLYGDQVYMQRRGGKAWHFSPQLVHRQRGFETLSGRRPYVVAYSTLCGATSTCKRNLGSMPHDAVLRTNSLRRCMLWYYCCTGVHAICMLRAGWLRRRERLSRFTPCCWSPCRLFRPRVVVALHHSSSRYLCNTSAASCKVEVSGLLCRKGNTTSSSSD